MKFSNQEWLQVTFSSSINSVLLIQKTVDLNYSRKHLPNTALKKQKIQNKRNYIISI